MRLYHALRDRNRFHWESRIVSTAWNIMFHSVVVPTSSCRKKPSSARARIRKRQKKRHTVAPPKPSVLFSPSNSPPASPHCPPTPPCPQSGPQTRPHPRPWLSGLAGYTAISDFQLVSSLMRCLLLVALPRSPGEFRVGCSLHFHRHEGKGCSMLVGAKEKRHRV